MKATRTEVTTVAWDLTELTDDEVEMIRMGLLGRQVALAQEHPKRAKEYHALYAKIFNAQFKVNANGKN